MTEKPNTISDTTLSIPIDSEIADLLVKQWLKLHLQWAQDTHASAVHRDDQEDAIADIMAMRHLLRYVGETL